VLTFYPQRRLLTVAGFATAAACSQSSQSVTQPGALGPSGPQGFVHNEQGAAVGGAVVVLSHLPDGVVTHVVSTGSDGGFPLPPTYGDDDYALTATTSDATAWHASLKALGPTPTVTVMRECLRVSGSVNGYRGKRDHIHLTRFSREIGDVFSIPLRDDGTFEGCVPFGEYVTSLAGD